ncbi:spinocerebellar ataxia type 10 protein domain-containing protein [Scheffersomyces amazonensis]|uniref:spinocerebellar ataxia type 10 protein domain-containing protein n=1 Tax=Scheffersomyces amazonensis TaxID=1078765 RepID=UPI00315CC3FD
MPYDSIEDGLDTISKILRSESPIESSLIEELQFLASLINATSTSSGSDDHLTWNYLEEIISHTYLNDETMRVRLYRAVLVLTRNIIIHEPSDVKIVSSTMTNLEKFATVVSPSHEFYGKTIEIYIQILANIQNLELSDTLINYLNDKIIPIISYQDAYIHPTITFLSHAFSSKSDDETHHNEQIYALLQVPYGSNNIMRYLESSFFKVNPLDGSNGHDHSAYDHILYKLLIEIITHESFTKWITSETIGEEGFIEWLKINQLLLTAESNWNNYQLTATLSWVIKAFQTYTPLTIETIEGMKTNQDNVNMIDGKHEQLIIIILDIISDLSKYHQAQKMLIHYNLLEPLVKLFRSIHQNFQAITLKSNTTSDSRIKSPFPDAKSIIIEIISYLAYENFEVQETIRQLHGLELVLSNCIIDDANPYIRERAIICLKYLLANNSENQKFVAALEAQGTNRANEEIIEKAGYELEFVDGKVQLKQKPST